MDHTSNLKVGIVTCRGLSRESMVKVRADRPGTEVVTTCVVVLLVGERDVLNYVPYWPERDVDVGTTAA